jgi:multidrug transporter EmrE-like cation transporter
MYGISVVLWILALSRVDVSYAYPMLSIGYILVAVFGWAIFGEDMSLNRIMGIFIIIVGVILISKP